MEVIDKCNIYKQECQIVLKNGERICKNCYGHGGFFVSARPKSRSYQIRGCMICKGEGKLDWISIVKKNPEIPKMKHVPMRCPKHRGSKCKSMKRLWKQKNMKDDIRMWQEY